MTRTRTCNGTGAHITSRELRAGVVHCPNPQCSYTRSLHLLTCADRVPYHCQVPVAPKAPKLAHDMESLRA